MRVFEMSDRLIDPKFRAELIVQSPVPNQVIYAAMHQDYSENFVFDELQWIPNKGIGNKALFPGIDDIEAECGDRIVRNLLNGDRGHFGCLEHPSITFNIGWFPHSVMQQVRTHRVGMTFDVQSFRYTGTRIIQGVELEIYKDDIKIEHDLKDEDINALTIKVAEGERDIEDIFYLRPVGTYTSRKGSPYYYSPEWRDEHLKACLNACKQYALDSMRGMAEEHARSLIPFDVRQHWVMSCNARSFLHLMDLRAKKDAQLECQQLCEKVIKPFIEWVPSVAEWYKKARWGKARLSP